MLKYFHVLLILTIFIAGGCGEKSTGDIAAESWRSTIDLVDPPPEIDTNNYKADNPNQEKLARLITPVDGPLTSLARFIDNRDTLPDVDWLELLMARFPWVNRVLVTDDQGTIIFMQPEIPQKLIEHSIEFTGAWRKNRLLTKVDYTDLGPELYMGRPYFKDIDFRGLIGVAFDPRTLMTLCPSPEELIIVHPGGGVWTRGAKVDRDALMAVDWEDLLADEVHGQLEIGDKYYTWLVRYLGQDPYVYVTESVDPDSGGSGWWFF